MRRLFWVGLGATLGVVAVQKVTRTVQAYSPAGMARGLSDLGEGLRQLADTVRDGMAERETELRYALGIDTMTLPEGREMNADQARALIEDPTSPRAR